MKSTTEERLKQCHKAIGLRDTFETTDSIEWTRKWCENYADNQQKLHELKMLKVELDNHDLESVDRITVKDGFPYFELICVSVAISVVLYIIFNLNV